MRVNRDRQAVDYHSTVKNLRAVSLFYFYKYNCDFFLLLLQIWVGAVSDSKMIEILYDILDQCANNSLEYACLLFDANISFVLAKVIYLICTFFF